MCFIPKSRLFQITLPYLCNCNNELISADTLVSVLAVSLAMYIYICMATTFISIRQCMVKWRLNKTSGSPALPDEFANIMETQGDKTT